jgi:hypothetical protein
MVAPGVIGAVGSRQVSLHRSNSRYIPRTCALSIADPVVSGGWAHG